MKRLCMLLPAMALAAACARAPDRIQPGMWEYEVVATSVDAPGLPADAQQQAQAALNQPQRSRECVTPDNAANPLREVRDQLTRSQGVTCQTSDDSFSDGVIRFRATCRNSAGGPGQVQLTLDGRFAPITLLADVAVDAEVPNPNGSGTQAVRTRGTIKGRRIGSCARP
ncbi:MAG TPA: DUF3617 family protein [Allosphingosinicella sp.]|nr:DUF3617 family protein [Allosphingosinicella sp.]